MPITVRNAEFAYNDIGLIIRSGGIVEAVDVSESNLSGIFVTGNGAVTIENYLAKDNADHGITPQTIIKGIHGGVLETLRGAKTSRGRVKTVNFGPDDISEEKIKSRIKELKENMKLAAKELEFEEAAKCRDEIKELNEALLLL